MADSTDIPGLDVPTAREICVAYLYFNGACKDVLSDADFTRIYCMADGFGPVGDAALGINGGYDWSHVRDSSPDALLAMAREITRTVNRRAAR